MRENRRGRGRERWRSSMWISCGEKRESSCSAGERRAERNERKTEVRTESVVDSSSGRMTAGRVNETRTHETDSARTFRNEKFETKEMAQEENRDERHQALKCQRHRFGRSDGVLSGGNETRGRGSGGGGRRRGGGHNGQDVFS